MQLNWATYMYARENLQVDRCEAFWQPDPVIQDVEDQFVLKGIWSEPRYVFLMNQILTDTHITHNNKC